MVDRYKQSRGTGDVAKMQRNKVGGNKRCYVLMEGVECVVNRAGSKVVRETR